MSALVGDGLSVASPVVPCGGRAARDHELASCPRRRFEDRERDSESDDEEDIDVQEAVYESDFDDDDAGGDPGGTSAAHAAAAAAERAAAAALSPAVLPAPAGGDDDVTAYDLFGSEDEGDPAPSLANEGAR